MRRQFEYTIELDVPDKQLTEYYGPEGWQLVAIVDVVYGKRFYFMRELQ